MKKNNPITFGKDTELAKWIDFMIVPETVESILEHCHEYLEIGQDQGTLSNMAESVARALDDLWKRIKSDLFKNKIV